MLNKALTETKNACLGLSIDDRGKSQWYWRQWGFLKETELIIKETNAELPLGNVWKIISEKGCLIIDQFMVHELCIGMVANWFSVDFNIILLSFMECALSKWDIYDKHFMTNI